MFYVYLLKENGIPFYVGKGKQSRMYSHISSARRNNKRSPVLDKIRQMLSNNIKLEYEKVYFSEDSQDAYNKEIEWIKKIGIENLKNLTNGGEGATRINTSPEHRKKISEGGKRAWKEGKFENSKKRNYNSKSFEKFKFSKKGKKDSLETRKRKSEGQKKLRQSGYKHSPEAIEKMREAGRKGGILSAKKRWNRKNKK